MRLYIFAIFLIFATFSLASSLDGTMDLNENNSHEEVAQKLNFKRAKKLTTKDKMNSLTVIIISTTAKKTTTSTTRKSLVAKKIFNFNNKL
jgi:hypothetical protein